MDTDGDGSVSADEKSSFDDQMKVHHGPHQGPPPGAEQAAGGTDGLNDLLKQMMAALQSYQTADSSTTTVSTSLLSATA